MKLIVHLAFFNNKCTAINFSCRIVFIQNTKDNVHRAKVIVFEFGFMLDDEAIEGTDQMGFLNGAGWRQRHQSNNLLSCINWIKVQRKITKNHKEKNRKYSVRRSCAHFRSNGIAWLDSPTVRFPCDFGAFYWIYLMSPVARLPPTKFRIHGVAQCLAALSQSNTCIPKPTDDAHPHQT